MMNTWEAHLVIAQKYIHRHIALPLAVYPYFWLEFLLFLLIVTIYVYLSLDINTARDELKSFIQPNSIQFKQSMRRFSGIPGSICGASMQTSIVRCEFINRRGRRRRTLSKMSWLMEDREEFAGLFAGDLQVAKERARRRVFVDKLTALTPAQFVRLDKEEQLRNKQTVKCMRSLTTLFNNVLHKRFSEPQLREQLDAAKEDCECSAVSHQLMQYLDSECVTDSLIDVLNDIIEHTNADNPLPMSGDLTALVYDIGNLRERATPLTERPFDVDGSTASSSTVRTSVSEDATNA